MAAVIKVINTPDGQFPKTFIRKGVVKAGSVESIKPVYLIIKDSGNAGYAIAAPDATASTAEVLGVATSTSNDTASADGTFEFVTGAALLVEIKAKTPGSLVSTMLYDQYTLDVTSGAYTLDQGTTTNGIFRLFDFDNTTDGNCIATLSCNL